MGQERTVIDRGETIEAVKVDFLTFVNIVDFSDMIGVKSDETLVMGIS
jgi:hypothetical protein